MKRITWVVWALALAVAACDSTTAPAEPADADEAALAQIAAAAGVVDEDRTRSGGATSLFDRLAGAIPGFGGFYFARCDLVVVLTERGAAELATELLSPLLRRYHASARVHCPDGGAVVVQAGQFTWQELSRYHAALRPIARTRGVGRIAISVPANRIVVHVAHRRLVEVVTALAERLGVPARVLEVVVR